MMDMKLWAAVAAVVIGLIGLGAVAWVVMMSDMSNSIEMYIEEYKWAIGLVSAALLVGGGAYLWMNRSALSGAYGGIF